jgi:hypothetical protein
MLFCTRESFAGRSLGPLVKARGFGMTSEFDAVTSEFDAL